MKYFNSTVTLTQIPLKVFERFLILTVYGVTQYARNTVSITTLCSHDTIM